jgi:hypothetical protein
VAYTDAMGIGFTAAAVVALMAAIAVRRWLPARQADVVGELGELPAAGSLSQAA